MKIVFQWILCILGCFLMIINFWGLYQGSNIWYKPEKIYKSKNHEPFSHENFRIKRTRDETEFDYAKRMTFYVHSHSTHYFNEENRFDNIHIMVVPFAWCWPLWVRGFWAACTGNKFSVEFCNAEMALERGYGFCSKRALALQDILRRNGVVAKARDLYGHVVCTAAISEKEVVLGPDYGFAARESLEGFHQKPELLLNYIDLQLYPEGYTDHLLPIYRAARWLERGDREYACKSDFELFLWRIVQWGLPLIFIYFWLNFIIRGRKKCTSESAGHIRSMFENKTVQ